MSITIGNVYTFTTQAYIDSYLIHEPEMSDDQGRAIFISALEVTNKLNAMITNNYYYNEINDEVCCVNAGKFLLIFYKTFANQKLLNNFSFRTLTDTIDKIQCISRCSAKIFSLSEALLSIGLNPDLTLINDTNIHNTNTNASANQGLQALNISIRKI